MATSADVAGLMSASPLRSETTRPGRAAFSSSSSRWADSRSSIDRQGAIALIDVGEQRTGIDSAHPAQPTRPQTAQDGRSVGVLARPLLVTCWQIVGKRRSGALRAWNRPGVGPGLTCGFGLEPPPESNRRPHPYHSCGPSPIEERPQVKVTRVTVNDRQQPPETAPYGTEMARRPAGLNMLPPAGHR